MEFVVTLIKYIVLDLMCHLRSSSTTFVSKENVLNGNSHHIHFWLLLFLEVFVKIMLFLKFCVTKIRLVVLFILLTFPCHICIIAYLTVNNLILSMLIYLRYLKISIECLRYIFLISFIV